MAGRIGRTIIALEVGDVSRIFTLIYAFMGCLSAISQLLLLNTEYIKFPIGIFFPFVHFTFDLSLPRPTFPFSAFLAVIGMVIVFAVSGAITGTVLTHAFNLIAKHTGGVEAKLVVLEPEPREEASLS